jgi:hypothetical protein
MSDFLSGFAIGFAGFAFVLILWKWIKWELSGTLAMTTKELCDALRHTHPSRTMCKEAADVIERLLQSSTEK